MDELKQQDWSEFVSAITTACCCVASFLGDKNSLRSQGSLVLNSGWALRCCLVLPPKDRDVVEMLVERGT